MIADKTRHNNSSKALFEVNKRSERTEEVLAPDPFDLGEFRYLAAGYLKFLIRARRVAEQDFLTAEELANWNLQNIDYERMPSWKLLQKAASALGTLNHDFLPRCGSGGILAVEEETPLTKLMEDLAFFVDSVGGGPFHNEALVDAAQTLREGRRIDWVKLANWDRLPQMREALDTLPHPGVSKDDNESSTLLVDDFVFRRVGDGWSLRYRGGEMWPLPPWKGFSHLHALICRPQVPIRALELHQRLSHFGPSGLHSDSSEDNGNGASDSGERMDEVARDQAAKRCSEIGHEIVAAKKNNDHAAINALEREKAIISSELNRSRGLGRRTRNLGDDNRKAAGAVSTAIRRAVEQISKVEPDAERHFLNSIQTGEYCVYRPSEELGWQT